MPESDITQEELEDYIEKHEKWLKGGSGEQFILKDQVFSHLDFRGANLEAAYLPRCKFNNCKMEDVNFEDSNLAGAVFITRIYLSRFNFNKADLRDAEFKHVAMPNTTFIRATLAGVEFYNCEMCHNVFDHSRARMTFFKDSDLSRSEFKHAGLNNLWFLNSNLSGVKGLFSQSEWIRDNLESTKEGVICYKQFNCYEEPPPEWDISEGSTIEEVVNYDRTIECGCGVNVAARDWHWFKTSAHVWECLIKWEWLPGVVVPYSTDGKFRTEKLKLVKDMGDQW